MRYLLTSLLCVFTLSLTAQVDCPNPYDGNGDGNVSIGDFLEMLAVFGDTDTDSDGVWDSLDTCVDLAACNYANDPSEPCTYIDVLGVCGGGCDGDGDDDGICDSEDDCVGVLDECGVCNGPGPTEVVIESITILYDSLYAEQIDEWLVFELGADTVFNYFCEPVFTGCGDLVAHEGHNYSTVQIGDQCWFAENCRYLPSVTANEDSYDVPMYYVYDYQGTDVTAAQATSNYETYGALYNWPAVMTEGICPSGWHIPSDLEFTQLTDFLGGENIAGEQMKSTSGWWSENGNGSNSSGFDGRPGGFAYSGGFYNYGSNGNWWSSSASDSSSAWGRYLHDVSGSVFRGTNGRYLGYSARCVIDYTDECGVLNGDNSTCADCCGVPNGDGSTCDGDCGACNDNSTCLDDCGVVNGDNSTCFTSCGDDIGHDGYDYSTVQIGEQCWFSENCRYLPEVSPSSEGSETAPYFYVYGYQGSDVAAAQATSNYETYGVLYNWTSVMTDGICPSGWHIPSDEEFTELTDFLGGESVAGGKMKEAGYDHWNSPNEGATNSSGWTGLPGGGFYSGGFYSGGFGFNGPNGYWWSASESGSSSLLRTLHTHYENVNRNNASRDLGFSARCVRN
jgi:uncharacterized protein (TIGR02145 family)